MKSIIIIEKNFEQYVNYSIKDFELLLKSKYGVNNFQELLDKRITTKKFKIDDFERFYFALIRFDKIGGYLCRFFNVHNETEIQLQNFLPDSFSKFERDYYNISDDYFENLLINDFNKGDEIIVLCSNELLEASNSFIKVLKDSQIIVYSNNLKERM